MMTTLYEVLDVPRNCDAERIKNAFRKAVKVNHPDLNADDPGATARLRLIVRAKTVLSDPELRADYDRMLDFEQQPRRPFSMLVTTLDARRIVVLAVVLAGAFTLFTYISETPVARVKVTESAAHEPVNVVDVRSPPPSDANAPDKSENVEASVPSTLAPPTTALDVAPTAATVQGSTTINAVAREEVAPALDVAPTAATVQESTTSNAIAREEVAPALDVAPTATTVQESTGVVALPPPLPSSASTHATSESLDGSVPSPVASKGAVSVEDTASAPSIASRATKKAVAAVHSEELTASLLVKDARFYCEQGIAAYRNGDFALAIADFNLAIQLDPNFKNAYIDRSIAYYRIREFQRAFADIAQAIRIEKPRR